MDPASPAYEVVIRWTTNDVRFLCPYLDRDNAAAILCDLELRPLDGGSNPGLKLLETILDYHGYVVDPAYRGD